MTASKCFGGFAILWAAALVSNCAPSATERPADLVLKNGKIVTLDETKPEAQAVAMTRDRITAAGTNEEIDAYIGPDTEVIDLEGQLAVPGFIEGHGHMKNLGEYLLNLDLRDAKSWDEIVDMVREAAAKAEADEWIFGRGWHQEKWEVIPSKTVEGFPIHEGLSAVSPNNPVYLRHASGHAAFANARALEASAITRDTPDPPGGNIVRDADGNLTGALRENAEDDFIEAAYNAWLDARPRAYHERMVEAAGEYLLSRGITTFHDSGADFKKIDFYKELADEGEMPVRLYVMVRYETNEAMDEKLPQYKMVNAANGFMTVRSIKRQIDGALGAHGAWLLEPYIDKPDSTGLMLEPVEEITRTAEIAAKHGFQVNTHAIGDRGNRETLDIYEKTFKAAGVRGPDLRWRIEHAQHVHPDDVPRFKELGVIASMQGNHCTSDAPWVPKRLGEERAKETSYLWRDFIEAGVVVTNGTDVPVEDANPIVNFHASITRKTKDGSLFYPEQRMTREEALGSYTIHNAYAAFEEDVKGSITPGKYADVVVLSKDIMTVPEEEILDAKVVYTILGGKIRYSQEGPTD